MKVPAIIIPVYSRPQALKRLLYSLDKGIYPKSLKITLIFSLEYQCTSEVRKLCENYNWEFGEKILINHSSKMGLKNHILYCGGLSNVFSYLIVLEDDLCVSPLFFRFADKAVNFYGEDSHIAGISLYSFIFNEFGMFPFVPIDDGFDVYFLQSASSWGQVWTYEMWKPFYLWYLEINKGKSDLFHDLHLNLVEWSDNSWKKYFNLYLYSMDKYFVVPRHGFSTNMGEVGTHYSRVTNHNTSSLSLRGFDDWHFISFQKSYCHYDPYFELTPEKLKIICPELTNYNFDTDFYGQKSVSYLSEDLVLSSRMGKPTTKEFSYDLRHFPPELNIYFKEMGSFFQLGEKKDICDKLHPDKLYLIRGFFYSDS